ncbi:MAG TPA: diaminopimelate epimerase [Chitinophagaceae bacterium]|nr:diaminopimelate epimerase [Chitinophagaceae bacterium]
MKISFYKYQGTGNDFILLDNRQGSYDSLTTKQVKRLCDRHFGIGGDGLILLNVSKVADFEMKYYNADGKEGSLCGNGGRCLVKFVKDLGIYRNVYKFKAADGIHEGTIDNDGTVSLKMNDVNEIITHGYDHVLNTGSPHYVHVTTNVMHLDVCRRGREIRYADDFIKEGINVNFVEKLDEPDKILVRTYERGVEDETYSCGTGVTAAAIVTFHNDNGFNSVDVKTKGGRLFVEFDKVGNSFRNIWLKGAVEKVFEGSIEL